MADSENEPALPRGAAPIHESLNRPLLLLGGERTYMILFGLVCGIFIFLLMHWWSFVLGIVLWFAGRQFLVHAAKADPQLSKTARRFLNYKAFYPAAATPFAGLKEKV